MDFRLNKVKHCIRLVPVPACYPSPTENIKTRLDSYRLHLHGSWEMSDRLTSWLAKAVIQHDRHHGANLDATRTRTPGWLVQIIDVRGQLLTDVFEA